MLERIMNRWSSKDLSSAHAKRIEVSKRQLNEELKKEGISRNGFTVKTSKDLYKITVIDSKDGKFWEGTRTSEFEGENFTLAMYNTGDVILIENGIHINFYNRSESSPNEILRNETLANTISLAKGLGIRIHSKYLRKLLDSHIINQLSNLGPLLGVISNLDKSPDNIQIIKELNELLSSPNTEPIDVNNFIGKRPDIDSLGLFL